jgi:hypothetical protein
VASGTILLGVVLTIRGISRRCDGGVAGRGADVPSKALIVGCVPNEALLVGYVPSEALIVGNVPSEALIVGIVPIEALHCWVCVKYVCMSVHFRHPVVL